MNGALVDAGPRSGGQADRDLCSGSLICFEALLINFVLTLS